MPDYFTQGFFVREPAWHGMGEVLEDYPGREEAMRIAGHDFEIIEKPLLVPAGHGDAKDGPLRKLDGWKALTKGTDGPALGVVRSSYGVVQNSVPWDIVDAIVSLPNVKYETAGTLKEGAQCWVLAWLDEPVSIPGDDSPVLPFLNTGWSHDGSTAVSVRSTSVRVVCANTQAMAELQGKRAGTDFTFRHTSKVMDRIEDAKAAVRGVRDNHAAYVELARELATMPVTANQRELFVSNFIPLPPEALISERVAANVEEARAAVRALFDGKTIPEPHRFTAYGLHMAGVEYLDHLRGWRNPETRFGRSLLRNEPAKTKLTKLVREVASA